jgi:3-hydroxyacyl-[acyl-carrier-protein] dehydratase
VSHDMADRWLPVTIVATDSGVLAEVELRADCPWFDGHFPGNPLLPGVAQLAMVEELLRPTLPAGWSMKRIDRTRFKRVIQPAERLVVKATRASDAPTESRWDFEVSSAGQLACTGVLYVGPAQG